MESELQSVIASLANLPGLELHADAGVRAKHGCGDALITITSRSGRSEYVAELERGVTTTTLPRVIAQLDRCRRTFERQPLLLAPYLTPAVTARLINEQIEFGDAAGNAYLDGPGAYVLVLGKKASHTQSDTGFTPTDLQLIFALLAEPHLRSATYRELNSVTGVSLGKISATLQQMESVGHVSRTRTGALLLRDPASLLARWEYGYLEQLRPSLHPVGWRVGPTVRMSDIHQRSRQMDGVLIGGEHAADAVTSHLVPATLTLHVPKNQGKAVASGLGLARGGDSPDVVTLERFVPNVEKNEKPTIDAYLAPTGERFAHPILVRAELLALDDSRLREIADRLLDDVIQPGLASEI